MNRLFAWHIRLLCVLLMIFSNNINSRDNQDLVVATIQNKLRDPRYIEHVLPTDFSDLTVLIDYSKELDNPVSYANSVFKIFTNLLRGCEFVAPEVLISFLQDMPSLLHGYFIPYKIRGVLRHFDNILQMDPLDRLRHSFTHTLHDSFLKGYYSSFRTNPEQFLQDLALTVFQLAEEEISVQTFRNNVLRFVELAISKLVWAPQDSLQSWESTKEIANELARLLPANIITDVDLLDDFFWALTRRYCFFIEVSGQDLPLSFYQEIKRELSVQEIIFLDLEEQARFLETKRDCLLRTLLTAEAQIKMVEHEIARKQ